VAFHFPLRPPVLTNPCNSFFTLSLIAASISFTSPSIPDARPIISLIHDPISAPVRVAIAFVQSTVVPLIANPFDRSEKGFTPVISPIKPDANEPHA